MALAVATGVEAKSLRTSPASGARDGQRRPEKDSEVKGLGNEPHCQRRPEEDSEVEGLGSPIAGGGRCQWCTASEGRQIYAGNSSAERTTDPYINLELMQNFKISAI